MVKRKMKSGPTNFERMVGACVQAGHDTSPLVVKGRDTIVCFERNTYLAYHAALGRKAADIAKRHFTEN